MASKLQAARARAKRLREEKREKQSEMLRKVTTMGSGYLLGSLESSGRLDALPALPMGLPRITTVGVIAGIGGMYVKGKAGDILDGVSDAALTITAYNFGRGAPIAGASDEAELNEAIAELQAANELDDMSDEELAFVASEMDAA